MNGFFEALAVLGMHVVRPVVALSWLPFAAPSSVGRRLTVPLALAIAMCMHPSANPAVFGASFVLLMLKEALVGFAIGLVLSRAFIVVGAAGAMVDQQAGYTAGATFNPTFGASTGPLESIFVSLFTLALVQGGGVLLMIKSMLASYASWPVGTWVPDGMQIRETLATLVDAQGQWVLDVALRVASPMLALLLLADVCVAVAGRYAQQLNPFSLSLAVKGVIATVALVVMAAYPWADILRQAIRGSAP